MKTNQYTVKLSGANKQCRFSNMHLTQIKRFLENNGHQVTKDTKDADYVLFHSCGTFDKFQEKSLDIYCQYVKSEKNAKVIDIGCLTKIYPELSQQDPNFTYIKAMDDLNAIFRIDNPINEFHGYTCQSMVETDFSYPQGNSGKLSQLRIPGTPYLIVDKTLNC